MKRPASVTTLLWMVLCLTAWNAIRLYAALADWTVLAEFAPRPGPLYIFGSASLWTFGGAALWLGFRNRSPRARAAAPWMLAAYTAWWWLDRLLLQQPNPNWPYALIVTIILLAFTATLLYHPRTKDYFRQRETHDPEPTHQETT